MSLRRKTVLSSSRPSFIEALESRQLLSASPAAAAAALSAVTAPPPFHISKHHIPTTISISASSTTAVTGQALVVTTKVHGSNGAPPNGGKVEFVVGASTVVGYATVSSRGIATGYLYNLFPASDKITAVFLGTGTYAGSTSASKTVAVSMPTTTTNPDGLEVASTLAGTGNASSAGNTLTVNYTGYLTTGVQFDSSVVPGRTPFSFQLGAGQVIPGFDEGLTGAKAGETRVLVIPPALGYGSTGQGNIPPDATLIFIINVVSVA